MCHIPFSGHDINEAFSNDSGNNTNNKRRTVPECKDQPCKMSKNNAGSKYKHESQRKANNTALEIDFYDGGDTDISFNDIFPDFESDHVILEQKSSVSDHKSIGPFPNDMSCDKYPYTFDFFTDITDIVARKCLVSALSDCSDAEPSLYHCLVQNIDLTGQWFRIVIVDDWDSWIVPRQEFESVRFGDRIDPKQLPECVSVDNSFKRDPTQWKNNNVHREVQNWKGKRCECRCAGCRTVIQPRKGFTCACCSDIKSISDFKCLVALAGGSKLCCLECITKYWKHLKYENELSVFVDKYEDLDNGTIGNVYSDAYGLPQYIVYRDYRNYQFFICPFFEAVDLKAAIYVWCSSINNKPTHQWMEVEHQLKMQNDHRVNVKYARERSSGGILKSLTIDNPNQSMDGCNLIKNEIHNFFCKSDHKNGPNHACTLNEKLMRRYRGSVYIKTKAPNVYAGVWTFATYKLLLMQRAINGETDRKSVDMYWTKSAIKESKIISENGKEAVLACEHNIVEVLQLLVGVDKIRFCDLIGFKIEGDVSREYTLEKKATLITHCDNGNISDFVHSKTCPWVYVNNPFVGKNKRFCNGMNGIVCYVGDYLSRGMCYPIKSGSVTFMWDNGVTSVEHGTHSVDDWICKVVGRPVVQNSLR